MNGIYLSFILIKKSCNMIDMQRVLHVIGLLAPGGAQTFLLNLYRSIDRSQLQFDFLVYGDRKGELEDAVTELGGKIFRIQKYRIYNGKAYIKEFKEIIAKNKLRWTAVEIHTELDAGILSKACHRVKIHSIAHAHSASFGLGFKGFIRGKTYRKLRKYVDIPFACSKQAAINRYGSKIAQKTYIVNNGIDLESFRYSSICRDKIRKQLSVSPSWTIYGHTGRFHESKNHLFLLEVFKEIKNIEKNSKLLLVGDGELLPLCKARAKALKIEEDVIFAGSKKDTYKYYSAFDKLIMPSIYEGIPLTMIEAQANGLPILASTGIDPLSKLVETVTFMDLSSGAKAWANVALGLESSNRERMYLNSAFKPYDIKLIAIWYMSFINGLINK